MPRTCTVCKHPDRAAIDRRLLAGEALRDVARHSATGKDALARHKAEHLPEHLVKAEGAREVADANGLLAKMAEIETGARRLLKKAEAAKDYRTAMAGIRELARLVELFARLHGEIRDRELNLQTDPLFDEERAIRIAEAFLQRRRPARALLSKAAEPSPAIDLNADGWKVV